MIGIDIAFALMKPGAGSGAAGGAATGSGCAACGGFMLVMIAVVIAWFALTIGLLVFVARDAKARGLDSSVIWMLLVFFTGLLGFLIYILARPSGMLVKCESCGNQRLQASAKCPTCGNAPGTGGYGYGPGYGPPPSGYGPPPGPPGSWSR